MPNTHEYSDDMTRAFSMCVKTAFKTKRRTGFLLFDLFFYSNGFHVGPHLLSHSASHPIGSNNDISLNHRLVRAVNQYFVWQVFHLDDFLAGVDSILILA